MSTSLLDPKRTRWSCIAPVETLCKLTGVTFQESAQAAQFSQESFQEALMKGDNIDLYATGRAAVANQADKASDTPESSLNLCTGAFLEGKQLEMKVDAPQQRAPWTCVED